MSFLRCLPGLLFLALWGAAGCASLPGAGSDDEEEPEPEARKVLVVENRYWGDVRVSVIRDGARHRLGTVTSMHTDTLVIPAVLTGGVVDLRFLAQPIGSSRSFLSEPVRVGPGEDVEWRLAQRLLHSAISIR